MKQLMRIAAVGVVCSMALAACSGAKTQAAPTAVTQADMNPAELLLLKTQNWVTKSLYDSNGKVYSGKDEFVGKLAGVTRYNNNGTFRSVSMDTSLVFEGNWSISDDGKILTMSGLGKDGRPGFRVEAPVLKLNNTEFNYRVYPNPNNRNSFFDVHMKPASINDTRVLNRESSANPNSMSSSQ